jgi:hypothetical protein
LPEQEGYEMISVVDSREYPVQNTFMSKIHSLRAFLNNHLKNVL